MQKLVSAQKAKEKGTKLRATLNRQKLQLLAAASLEATSALLKQLSEIPSDVSTVAADTPVGRAYADMQGIQRTLSTQVVGMVKTADHAALGTLCDVAAKNQKEIFDEGFVETISDAQCLLGLPNGTVSSS